MAPPALVADDAAATPVIGIILMVLVTMLLAAIVGSFALGLSSLVDTGPPAADLQFVHDGDGNLTIVHEGGEAIPEDQVAFGGDVDLDTTDCADERWAADGESISAGDVCVLSPIAETDTVLVIWSDRNSSGYVGRWAAE